MKRALPTIAIAALAALTGLSGVLHGRVTQRWGISRDAKEAGAVLQRIPAEVGEWRLEGTDELTETVRNTLQCEDYLVRTYLSPSSGERVSVAVLLGPPGPMAVHTPEICYSSREYESTGETTKVTIPSEDKNSEFWRSGFRSRRVDGQELHVYYAWSDGGHWTAAKSPRFEYAGESYLYKLQLATLAPMEGSGASDAGAKFLDDFVPVWRQAVSSVDSAR